MTAAPTSLPGAGASASPVATATPSGGATTGASGVWSAVSSSPDGYLDGVTCLSTADCWAVGTQSFKGTLVEQGGAGGWSVDPSAVPVDSSLQAVACASAGECWAVGTDGANGLGKAQALIEQGTSAGWSTVAAPAPSGSQSDVLNDVTCVTADDCWAVGSYGNPPPGGGAPPTGGTLMEQYTGDGWSIVPSPSPPGLTEFDSLTGVTCVSADDCWAVGGDQGGTLIEQYTGSVWTIVNSPNPSATATYALNAITCVDADDCWAVGAEYGPQEPLIERYSDGGWSVVPSPTPPGPNGDILSGISCAGADDCWAVGGVDAATGPSQSLIEQDTGSGWSIVESPNPSSESSLEDVACVSADACWAVGNSGDQTGSTLIEQYSSPTS